MPGAVAWGAQFVISDTLGTHSDLHLVSLGDGRMAAAWTQAVAVGDDDVRVRMMAGDGAMTWGGSFRAHTGLSGVQRGAEILSDSYLGPDSSGNFTVGFQSGGQLYYRTFGPTGGPLTTEQILTAGGSGTRSSLSWDVSGAASAFELLNSGSTEIGYRRFGDATDTIINTTTGGEQTNPDFAVGISKGVIVWTDASQTGGDTSGQAIRGRVITFADRNNNPGAPDVFGTEFVINTTTPNHQNQARIAASGDGFLVVWTDASGQGGDSLGTSIQARRLDSNGALTGVQFKINTNTFSSQDSPELTGLNDRRWAVVWVDQDTAADGSGSAIKLQIVNADGTLSGAEVLVNTITTGNQTQPTVNLMDDGRIMVGWTSGTEVHARIFEPRETGIVLDGTSRADTYYGSNFADEISGFDGDDRIDGWYGDDILSGGAGIDWMWGGGGADTLYGGDGADALYGDDGDDDLNGGDGDDVLAGRSGNDTFSGGEGEDVVFLSGFRNEYDISMQPGGVFLIQGPDGADTVLDAEYAQFTDRIFVFDDPDALVGTFGNNTINGTALADRVRGLRGDDTIFGNDGSDVLNGDAGNDTLVGNAQIFVAQTDTLNGGDGDDLLYGEAVDVLNGGAGRDSLIAINSYDFTLDMAATSIEYAVMDFGNDVIDASGQTVRVDVFASGGNDTVTGSVFSDALFGGSGADVITGGAGDDAIVGEAGADSLNGGDGDDRIYLDAQDTSISGGSGYDAAYITPGAGGGVSINLAVTSIEFIQDLAGGNDIVHGLNKGIGFSAYLGGGQDNVQGSAYRDILYGEAGGDHLFGNFGNDVLSGGAGADSLIGGEGLDAMYGGVGDGQTDRFIFHHAGAANADAVYDFVIGQDKLDFIFLNTTFANLTINTAGGSSVVYRSGQIVCTVVGVVGLTASDFLFTAADLGAPGDRPLDKGPLVLPEAPDDTPWTPTVDPDATGPGTIIHSPIDLVTRPLWVGHDNGWLTVLV